MAGGVKESEEEAELEDLCFEFFGDEGPIDLSKKEPPAKEIKDSKDSGEQLHDRQSRQLRDLTALNGSLMFKNTDVTRDPSFSKKAAMDDEYGSLMAELGEDQLKSQYREPPPIPLRRRPPPALPQGAPPHRAPARPPRPARGGEERGGGGEDGGDLMMFSAKALPPRKARYQQHDKSSIGEDLLMMEVSPQRGSLQREKSKSPPPPPPPPARGGIVRSRGGRGGGGDRPSLLQSITKGQSLKKIPPRPEKPTVEGHKDLLSFSVLQSRACIQTEEDEESWSDSDEEAFEEEGICDKRGKRGGVIAPGAMDMKKSSGYIRGRQEMKDKPVPAPAQPVHVLSFSKESAPFGNQFEQQSGIGFGSVRAPPPPSASSLFGNTQRFGSSVAFGAPVPSIVNSANQYALDSGKNETSGFSFGQPFGGPTQQMTLNSTFGGPVTQPPMPQQQMFGGFGFEMQRMGAAPSGGFQPRPSKKTHGNGVPPPPPTSSRVILRPSKLGASLGPPPPPPPAMATQPAGAPPPPPMAAQYPGKPQSPRLTPMTPTSAGPLPPPPIPYMAAPSAEKPPPPPMGGPYGGKPEHLPMGALPPPPPAQQVSWRTMGMKSNLERESKEQKMEVTLDSPQEKLCRTFLKAPERKEQEKLKPRSFSCKLKKKKADKRG
ncbi:uncharacterized protein LOC134282206 isoform X2 [Saccostrea cucullata]|uniref:uncharacterized protein LOC134282206 isoform X2 n=1 Tax=Saccostrea cuccullata TaxID=36930 RepID=UPI002ED4533A